MSAKRIITDGDRSDHGGYIVAKGSSVLVNGKHMCVDQDMHVCPRNGHGTTPVTSTTIHQSNGRGFIRAGDKAQCGATMIGGSDIFESE